MTDLQHDPRLVNEGRKESIRASDFDQDTLKQDTEVTVWSNTVADDQLLYHGFGPKDREFAEAFAGLDVVASGNGTGTAGDAVTGDVVLAITDSQGKRVLASTTFDSLSELADAQGQDRTQRIVESALAPYARPGRNLEVRIEADSNSDGVEIDPSASSGKLYYGLIQR